MTLLITISAFVAALGCLIVVHEFGHYLVARWCNVKVLRFSVGFGKPLWRKPLGRDHTEWVIAAFPLGGYVKMLDEREGEVAAAELPRAFNRQPVAKRFAIVVAGPVANFILAVVLYWGLLMHGVPGIKPVVGPVMPNTPAAAAGFTPGETILKIRDEPVKTWQDVRWLLLQNAVQKTTVPIEARGEKGEIVSHRLDLSGLSASDLDADFVKVLGLTRFHVSIKPVIGGVASDSPAERAGFREGDEIVAIDGRRIDSWDEVVAMVRRSPERMLHLEIRRGSALLPAIGVVPRKVMENGQAVGQIGAAPFIDRNLMSKQITEVRYGPAEGLLKALYKTWDTSIFSLKMLGKMIVGEVSLKNLSGPITIADYAGQSAQGGWVPYLLFLALISISLGVLNLLPIPILDGGHLMYYMVEVFKGSPVSDKTIEIGQHAGMALLFVLMAFALYNDITRLISG
ncbi:MAG TPA: RIP metalloprotease RseP [Burkholderiales bacterium]|nr:RIP metalloprotease RseP [Burkholderiales bacterium]